MTRIYRPHAERLGRGLIGRDFHTDAARVRVLFHTAGAPGLRYHVAELYAGPVLLHEVRTPGGVTALRAFWDRIGADFGPVMVTALEWVEDEMRKAEGVA